MNFADTLKQLALDKFKTQFNKSFDKNDCDIYQVEPTYGTDLGFEILTKRDDDNVRIRIYIKYGSGNWLQNYKLELGSTLAIGSLGDEIYVALGEITSYYKEEQANPALGIPKLPTNQLPDNENNPPVLNLGDFIFTDVPYNPNPNIVF